MDGLGRKERKTGEDLVETLPRDPPLRATSQPLVPDALDRLAKATEGSRVPGDAVVPVMPTKLRVEIPLLHPNWLVAVPSAPVGNALDRSRESTRGCSPLDGPLPPKSAAPVMREPEEVERPGITPLAIWGVEPYEARLLRVQLEAIPREPLRQHVQHHSCVRFVLEAQDHVVGVANHEASAFQPRLHVSHEPLVHHFMQVDVRQER